jgi:hypothetical protein
MLVVFYVLDGLAIVTALGASWLWYAAGRRPVRRISRFEELNYADLNRLVVAMNRNALLNRRAALATAASSACIALRFAASLAVPS